METTWHRGAGAGVSEVSRIQEIPSCGQAQSEGGRQEMAGTGWKSQE